MIRFGARLSGWRLCDRSVMNVIKRSDWGQRKGSSDDEKLVHDERKVAKLKFLSERKKRDKWLKFDFSWKEKLDEEALQGIHGRMKVDEE
ncbi:hypothetical protein Tco_0250599 [Tanacetum coccineum]